MWVDSAERPALAAQAFASLMTPFEPFEAHPTLGVAVSGGRDSLALALLAHEWAAARRGRVLALIVDHGLRAEAAAEAEATCKALAEVGIDAQILHWSGPKPGHGIQEVARAERYRLLLAACRGHGIIHLLVAHHAEDQAETVAMRAARGSGADGLAGMAALVEHADARILRPLLGVSRARLEATLRARGLRWIDDPSNDDLRFERARLRASRRPLPRVERSAAQARTEREQELARVAVDALEFDDDCGGGGESAAIDCTALGRLDSAVSARLLGRIVQALGGRDYPARRDRLARAVARLMPAGPRGKSGKSRDFTLSRCRLMLRQGPDGVRLRWIVCPENGKKILRKGGQPLIPAAFFACGGRPAPHVE